MDPLFDEDSSEYGRPETGSWPDQSGTFDPDEYDENLPCGRPNCRHILFEHAQGEHGLACCNCGCPIFLLPA